MKQIVYFFLFIHFKNQAVGVNTPYLLLRKLDLLRI